MKKFVYCTYISLIAISIFGCANPQPQSIAEDKNQLTLGKVQQSIKKGMKQDEVVAALGSPNMVTKDSAGNVTWIYDKFKTETNASASQGSSFLGGNSSANASTVRSQKFFLCTTPFLELYFSLARFS